MAWLTFDDPRLRQLLLLQDGVVACRQLHELGATDGDIARMVRRRDLSRVCHGVLVAHTGPLTPRQREWAAVLALWPAALAGESALGGSRPAKVQVVIAHGRTVRPPPWVEVRRTTRLQERVRWQASPPRQIIEHALLDVMARCLRRDDVAEAYAALTRVIHDRRTTIPRLREALASRDRVTGRQLISSMLDDLAAGACSVLERGYLNRVERAHGLPLGRRQPRSHATGRRTDQDVHYEGYGLIVELDGQTFHDGAQARDADADRDLAELAVSRTPTARVTYGLVFTTPCRTARWIAMILRHHGWDGDAARCARC